MVLGVFDKQHKLLRQKSIKTLSPSETMPEIIDFFKGEEIESLGLASFGPVDLNKNSKTYGCITSTPKLAWRNFPILPLLKDALKVPCYIDTDVNASALAEATMGAAKGLKNCVYITIGTGIGAGILSGGNLVHGLQHPEMGHVLLARHKADPMEKGVCPYHDCCAESLASGPSMQKRWGTPAENIEDTHIAWEIEAYYIAQLCAQALLTLSTERIVLGGGVMHREILFPLIRKFVREIVGSYIVSDALSHEGIQKFIVPPMLYPISGLVGASLLAERKL